MKRSIWILILTAALALGLWLGVSAWQGGHELTVTCYELETELTEPLRIVQLSDLHGWSFGEDNAELIRLVKEQEPDLILMTGDMLDRSEEDPEVACDLIRALADTAPIYWCYGNHEMTWMEKHGGSLTPALEEAGAVVLDTAYVDVQVKGQALRLGGYHGYWRQPHMFPVSEEQKTAELAFAAEFEDTDRYKILLCHIPTAWLDWGYIDRFPVDLVLTGHYHGGQIVLPLMGGLYAPYVGWFPEYTRGLYEGERATCVLSAGLGASPGIPRINNLPEIVVVDLIPGGES